MHITLRMRLRHFGCNMNPEDQNQVIEKVIEDFEPEVIMRSGQCFRMTEERPGTFLLIAGSHLLRLHQEGKKFFFYCRKREYEEFWKGYFDLDTDYASILRNVDPSDNYLMHCVNNASGLRILRQDLYETIITFIISQRNNIPRIRRCVENLCRRYGLQMKNEGECYYAFPKPESLAQANLSDLQNCNLGYRAEYVKRASGQILEGTADPKVLQGMSDADAKEELMKLFGVGTKVADCVLLFSLHRTGAFPVDTHIRQVLDKHYPEGFPFERYEGSAGILQQYLFYGEVN